MRDVEILRILADEYRDGMGILRARDAQTDERGLRTLQRDLGSDDGRRWGRRNTRRSLCLCHTQRVLIGDDCLLP